MSLQTVDPLVLVSNYNLLHDREIWGNIQFEGGSIAVLARPQGGTIHNPRTEYFPLVYSSLESSNLIGQLEGSTARRLQVYYM